MALNESVYLIRVTVFLWLKIALHGKLAHVKSSWENHFASDSSLKLFERLSSACFKILPSQKAALPLSTLVLFHSLHQIGKKNPSLPPCNDLKNSFFQIISIITEIWFTAVLRLFQKFSGLPYLSHFIEQN